MRISKQARAAVVAAVGAVVLGGCAISSAFPAASELPDGQYSGTADPESDGSAGTITFTVSGGKITEASFVIKDKDGTPHDDAYGLGSDGKPVDQTFYQRAQNAIVAEQQFVSEFIETGDQSQVDAIAGATLSYRQFIAAIDDAIESHHR